MDKASEKGKGHMEKASKKSKGPACALKQITSQLASSAASPYMRDGTTDMP